MQATALASDSRPPIALPDSGPVAAYYDACQPWYRWFYSDATSLGIHYGLWNEERTGRKEALLAPYREVIRLLQPAAEDRVLDAGCGLGGASLWLAANTPAHFTGVTISTVQAAAARRLAAQRRLEDRVEFHRMDYRGTEFPDACFHKAFGIESLCYSYPEPELAFREMHRLLTPGGKFLMLDGMLTRQPANDTEAGFAGLFCRGFRMRGWNTRDEILRGLEQCGFRNILFEDQTKRIAQSVHDIHRRHRIFQLLRLVRPLGIVPEAVLQSLLATEAQKKMYETGLFGYGLFYAEK